MATIFWLSVYGEHIMSNYFDYLLYSVVYHCHAWCIDGFVQMMIVTKLITRILLLQNCYL